MNDLVTKLKNRETKLSVLGLGYVGLPIAIEFAERVSVIGFDTNQDKISLYLQNIDPTQEVGEAKLRNSEIEFTSDEKKLREARFHIVAVPTPITKDKRPDLSPLKTASKILGRNLTRDSIVVYESTVYPGTTEEICIPILELQSGLKCGVDFKVGYSPERINPADKKHKLNTIVKVISGMDDETRRTIRDVYQMVVEAGVYEAESIKIAEAAKVIENSQRDINIAFINELSIIFHKLGIDTQAVLKAANTKWNFLDFRPGLVGGHCIGVDPYYLTYKAEFEGYSPQVILAGRQINDHMGNFVAQELIKLLARSKTIISRAQAAVLGFSFKENCPDIRNTRVIDIVKELEEYGISVTVADPVADIAAIKREYGIQAERGIQNITGMDAVIIAVGHEAFRKLKEQEIRKMYRNASENPILMDIKGIMNPDLFGGQYTYWRL